VIRRLVLVGLVVSLALPGVAAAANKDIERLQIQIAALQGQIADLQRQAEDQLREMKRINDLLAEQNAAFRKSLDDGRLQDEAVRTNLKEILTSLGQINEGIQALPVFPPAAPAPATGSGDSGGEPGTGEASGSAPAGPAPPPRELYSQAYADFARGNYDLAIQSFEQYLHYYADTDFSDNAQYWIGECHYGKGEYEAAIEAWDTLLRDYPASDKLPDARVKKGMALEKLGRRSAALLEYRFVVDRYPNSQAARIARDRLNPR
jgi:tol-pal system protein YbgF